MSNGTNLCRQQRLAGYSSIPSPVELNVFRPVIDLPRLENEFSYRRLTHRPVLTGTGKVDLVTSMNLLQLRSPRSLQSEK